MQSKPTTCWHPGCGPRCLTVRSHALLDVTLSSRIPFFALGFEKQPHQPPPNVAPAQTQNSQDYPVHRSQGVQHESRDYESSAPKRGNREEHEVATDAQPCPEARDSAVSGS